MKIFFFQIDRYLKKKLQLREKNPIIKMLLDYFGQKFIFNFVSNKPYLSCGATVFEIIHYMKSISTCILPLFL